MRIALDTNILAYAKGVDDPQRQAMANDLLQALRRDDIHIPVQVLGEFYNVLIRKKKFSSEQAYDEILKWSEYYHRIDTSAWILHAAMELASTHQLYIWDAVVFAAAVEAKCPLLLSEDMQDGFTWGGVTVINPFAQKRNPLLSALLDDPEKSS